MAPKRDDPVTPPDSRRFHTGKCGVTLKSNRLNWPRGEEHGPGKGGTAMPGKPADSMDFTGIQHISHNLFNNCSTEPVKITKIP